MFTGPKVIRGRGLIVLGLIAILVIASLALITAAILDAWSSTARDGCEVDQIPVVRNLVIPVPTPAAAEIRAVASQFPMPRAVELLEPAIVPVPVPDLPF